jgi:hypothetical protein
MWGGTRVSLSHPVPPKARGTRVGQPGYLISGEELLVKGGRCAFSRICPTPVSNSTRSFSECFGRSFTDLAGVGRGWYFSTSLRDMGQPEWGRGVTKGIQKGAISRAIRTDFVVYCKRVKITNGSSLPAGSAGYLSARLGWDGPEKMRADPALAPGRGRGVPLGQQPEGRRRTSTLQPHPRRA